MVKSSQFYQPKWDFTTNTTSYEKVPWVTIYKANGACRYWGLVYAWRVHKDRYLDTPWKRFKRLMLLLRGPMEVTEEEFESDPVGCKIDALLNNYPDVKVVKAHAGTAP